MKELCSFGPWMKCNVNIALLYFLKVLIMLKITLCCNRDIIPTWCVRKSVSQLTFWKEYIFTYYGWYKFCMNRRINHLISRPTPCVKTCNEKLKWDTEVYVPICRYDMYEWIYACDILLTRMLYYEITWGQDNESISYVTCCSALLYELVMIMRLE
jgi:hypothetical protein